MRDFVLYITLKKFKLIEETLETMNSLQLVETITELQNNNKWA